MNDADAPKPAIILEISSCAAQVAVTITASGPPEDAERLAGAAIAAFRALGFQVAPAPVRVPAEVDPS